MTKTNTIGKQSLQWEQIHSAYNLKGKLRTDKEQEKYTQALEGIDSMLTYLASLSSSESSI